MMLVGIAFWRMLLCEWSDDILNVHLVACERFGMILNVGDHAKHLCKQALWSVS